MNRTLQFGSQGPEVKALQACLNSTLGAAFHPLAIDGIFGPQTLAAVKQYQSQNGLAPDGIVGPLTWGKLKPGPSGVTHPDRCNCGKHQPLSQAIRDSVIEFFAAATVAQNLGGSHAFAAPHVSFSSPIPSVMAAIGSVKTRKVNSTEISLLMAVYGSSIDFTKVVMTNQTGAGGRAFVVPMPSPIPFVKAIQVVNIGTVFDEHDLIHEFGHVWQSQHGANSTDYLTDALASQAAEEIANAVTGTSNFSAYAYVPGRAFKTYGAEQLAQQAANGEAPIIAHMKGVAAHATDFDLNMSMTGRFEDTTKPGVKLHPTSRGRSLTF